jgi:predicted acetyltransferase
MNRVNLCQINFNGNQFEESPKSFMLLLALAVIPVYWGSYNLSSWIVMMGVSFIGLCLMKEHEVDHKNIKLLCNSLIRCLKVLKEK